MASKGYNKAVLMGNLTRDPEVRYTVDKRAWARFTVAVNYTYKNRNGEFQDEANFIPVVAWGPLGENCGRYLKKGRPVLVEGRIQTRSYDASDGSGKKYVTEVVANDVVFLGGRQDSSAAPYDAPPPPGVGAPSPFPDDGGFGRSISEQGFSGEKDFNDEFPTDFAAMERNNGGPEAEIPF